MIEQVAYQLLSEDAAVSELVSGRIYFAERPHQEMQVESLPAVVIHRGGENPRHTMTGPAGWATGFFRVTVLGRTYLGADDAARAVQSALNGYRGTRTVDEAEFSVGRIELTGTADIPSEHRDGAGSIQTHGINLDFDFQVRQPVPAGN